MTSLKIGAVVLLMIGCFGAGWYANRHEPTVITQTQTVEKIVTKVVTEKVSGPDGTVKETTTTEKTEDSKVAAKEPKSVPNVATYRPQYSVGIKWNPLLFRDERYSPTGVDFGYRVLGNAWGVAGYDWHTKEVTVGVRFDF